MFFRKKAQKIGGIDFIQSIAKLELKKGDVVIIKTDRALSSQAVKAIRSFILDTLPDREFKVLVLEPGIDIEVHPPTSASETSGGPERHDP